MKFIANLIINLSNVTIPIAYIILILGAFIALIQGLGKIQQKKNDLIIKKIAPEVENIKQKYVTEDEQLENLNQLYKQNHFSALKPIVIKVIGSILYAILILTVFYGKNFDTDKCVHSVSFFSIENIFIKTIMIIIPILIIVLKLISLYLFIPKELINKKEILSTFIIYIITIGILSNILTPSYSLFLLGFGIGEFIISIPLNKLKRTIYYKYPPVVVDVTNETNLAPKKSTKEIIADLKKDLKL